MRTFTFRNRCWIVKRQDGEIVFRQAAYYGGVWSSAIAVANNTSIHPTFRRYMKTAIAQIEGEEASAQANHTKGVD